MKDKTQIFNDIAELVDNGSTVAHAITVTCKEYGLNPNIIYNEFFKKADKIVDKDSKTNELRVGDIVYLNNDSNKTRYEVININNNSNIVLRNADDNSQISASESEITPVIMENTMDKLNEAQYNISINGLETEDADALSNMLAYASQAENSSTASNPLTADPMGMEEPEVGGLQIGMPSSVLDDSGDDISFDEELPASEPISEPEADLPAPVEDSYEEIPAGSPAEISDEEMPAEDSFEIGEEEPAIDDMSMDDMMDDGMYDDIDEDVLMDPSMKDSTFVANEKNDEIDEELEDLMRESLDIAGVDDLNFDLNEAEEIAPGEDFFDDEGALEEVLTPQEDFANDIVSDDDKIEQDEKAAELVGESEECEESFDEDLDEHINAILRNAGVQINEADEEVADNTNVGEPVTDESIYVNDAAEEQGNVPEYQEVDTTTFGKDASEGFKENPLTMTFESTINKKKIKSIYETAKSMYKKHDSADWLKLDRRYIEKLILEGVGYETASKMLTDAKKGK